MPKGINSKDHIKNRDNSGYYAKNETVPHVNKLLWKWDKIGLKAANPAPIQIVVGYRGGNVVRNDLILERNKKIIVSEIWCPVERWPEFESVVRSATPSTVISDPRYEEIVSVPDGVHRYAESYDAVVQRRSMLEDSEGMILDVFNPLIISPVAERPYDRSLFDVRNVSTNLSEWLQANRAFRPDERILKILPPLFDPNRQPDWLELFESEIVRRLSVFNLALNGIRILSFLVEQIVSDGTQTMIPPLKGLPMRRKVSSETPH
jgi:hypothetical protein